MERTLRFGGLPSITRQSIIMRTAETHRNMADSIFSRKILLAATVFLKASASDLSGLGNLFPMMSDMVFPTMLDFL